MANNTIVNSPVFLRNLTDRELLQVCEDVDDPLVKEVRHRFAVALYSVHHIDSSEASSSGWIWAGMCLCGLCGFSLGVLLVSVL